MDKRSLPLSLPLSLISRTDNGAGVGVVARTTGDAEVTEAGILLLVLSLVAVGVLALGLSAVDDNDNDEEDNREVGGTFGGLDGLEGFDNGCG